MYLAFTTFTILWVMSCTILYLGLIRKNEEAFHKTFEANQLYADAKRKNAEAQAELEKAIHRLEQIEKSLMCSN